MLRPSVDPRSPQRKPRTQEKKQGFRHMLPAVGASAVAIAVIMFSLGKMPQIDKAGANLNSNLQAHNDIIVAAIIHSLPSVLFGFGVLLFAGLVWGSLQTKRTATR